MRNILLFGKTLRAVHTKVKYESLNWPRIMNLGKVIIEWIGQPACLSPKPAVIGYGEASETERMLVVYEGLVIPRQLKIQSRPSGKLER